MKPVKGLLQSVAPAQAPRPVSAPPLKTAPPRTLPPATLRVVPRAYGREQLVGHMMMGRARGARRNFTR